MLLRRYADILASTGVERGLLGPREVPRLWDRHILNCAVVAEPTAGLIPAGSLVADVGSGAGLPGLVWAILRSDITVVLIEPLLRRSTFLLESIEELGLSDRVRVVRARAEDGVREPSWIPADVVTARAVAPLPTLVSWMVPLLRPGGVFVALKGQRAAEEVDEATNEQLTEVMDLDIRVVGAGVVEPPTTVVTGRRRTAQ
jgi:16S rRNA (guanine527-N7)-methyltransferase